MAGLSIYLMGAIAGVLVDLRNEWAVQILVLISFSLQVYLLMFAWIRRGNASMTLRFLLWLAYQLADSTALFTLGHMAIRARSPDEQQLMAFWAPFLLVHLGGQDTITAYSFEDNRLWLRHLQTLVVQILGAAYVLYKYIPGSETSMRVAAILVFVVGCLKYGERIWALRSASMDYIWSSLEKKDARQENKSDYRVVEILARKRKTVLDDEEILMAAHSLLDVCKALFIGSRRIEQAGYIKNVMQQFQDNGQLDRLMEMELSLMYDIMYTKAAVIHTWSGYCIRVISTVATATAFMLFGIIDKGRHKKNDVIITYVLLAGAMLLETASLVKAAASTWTVYLFHKKGWFSWLVEIRELQECRQFSRAAAHRTWSGTVGQYSLLQSWASEEAKPTTGTSMAELMGLERLWCQLHHSWSGRISTSSKELVLREILLMGNRRNVSSQPGLLVLQKYNLDDSLGWSVRDSELERSIIAWHVATEIITTVQHIDDDANRLRQACQEVSRYMMFLFMVRPYMLPGPVRWSPYTEARDGWNEALQDVRAKVSVPKQQLDWVATALGNILDLKNQNQWHKGFLDIFSLPSHPSEYHGPAIDGFNIAKLLRSEANILQLQVILSVWVEMLCYVANHCSRESHVSQLSSGGELITIAWLMAGHANFANISEADAPHYRWKTFSVNNIESVDHLPARIGVIGSVFMKKIGRSHYRHRCLQGMRRPVPLIRSFSLLRTAHDDEEYDSEDDVRTAHDDEEYDSEDDEHAVHRYSKFVVMNMSIQTREMGIL